MNHNVPTGRRNRPVADSEAENLLFEPSETRNTGTVEDEKTKSELGRIDGLASAGSVVGVATCGGEKAYSPTNTGIGIYACGPRW